MTGFVRRTRRTAALASALFLATALQPAATHALDTRVSLHSSPGSAYPTNIHIEVVPVAGALKVDTFLGSPRISFTGYGPGWSFEFNPPDGIPFDVGVYDTCSTAFDHRYAARFHLTYDNVWNGKPYSSFTVREARKDAQGKLVSLWVTFLYRPSDPSRPPLVGEIRWNADTTMYIRNPRHILTGFGEPTTFDVEGIDTRGRPVTLTAANLPAGATFTPTGPGRGTVQWPSPPASEQTYPIRFTAINDEGLQDTTTTYVQVKKPFLLDVRAATGDPVSAGVNLTSTHKNSTIFTSVGGDSTFALNVYSGYHASSWVFTPPTGFALRPGTYAGYRLHGSPTPTEAAVLAQIDGRNCTFMKGTVLRIREYRIDSSFRVTSLWAELEQACEGSTGVLRTEIRYNTAATFDVQAPAIAYVARGAPVRIDVTTRSLAPTPPSLAVLTAPSGATFVDRGDGTGEFTWINAIPSGQVAIATFVATAASGERDTVTTRIQSRVPFLVKLAGVPGDYAWTGTPYLYDASNGTVTFSETADSSLAVGVTGLGHGWAFVFSAAAGRSLTTGVYDTTVPDVQRAVSMPRLRGARDDVYACSNDARFHIRKLARTPTGAIRSFWATFSIACGPGATPQVGEIRYDADTSLYVSAPDEVRRMVGQPFQFTVRATAVSSQPVQLAMLSGPAGSSLADQGDGSARFDQPAGASTNGLTRVVVRSMSAAGVADTSVTMLRAAVPARFDAWSAPGDQVALGLGESRDQNTAIFSVKKLTNGGISASIATPTNLWTLGFRAGGGNKPLTTGVHTGARYCGNCFLPPTTPALDVTKDGRLCPFSISNGTFDVRKLKLAPDGSVRSFWVRFSQTCSGALSGDLRYDADSSVYLRTPSYATTEVGRPLSLTVSAVETRGLPLTFSAPQLPAGSTLMDHGDGTATLQWPAGAPSVGLYPITWVATSSDGAADTSSTTLEAFRTALFAFQGPAAEPIGAGQNLRLTGADGIVASSTLGDSAVRLTFDGSGHFLEYYLQSPWGRSLRQGTFSRARRYLVSQWDEAALHVKVDNRLCDLDAGQFHVRRLRRDASGAIASLWVTFSQSCTTSPEVLTGEIRMSADTSLYIEAPAEVERLVGDPVAFTVRAVDSRDLPATLSAVELPPGASLSMSGPAVGDITWAPSDTAGSVSRIVFAALSEHGATDTVVTLVRTFARAFIKMSSAPGDYLGQGKQYDLRPSTGTLTATRAGNKLTVLWRGRLDTWNIEAFMPPGRTPAVGAYDGMIAGVLRPALNVATSGRSCPSPGRFQIRRIEFGPGDRVDALWMTFEVTCTKGLTGEVWIGADSTYWVDGPADLYPDPGQAVSYSVTARGTLAADVAWSLASAPLGATLVPTGPGTVRIDAQAGTLPGDYPVALVGTGAAGSATLTTWIHVPKPSFVAIRSAPNYLFPQGIDRKYFDRDVTFTYWRDANNFLSARFDGAVRIALDFSRADRQRIVPGDYVVTGPIPPVGTSPNGIYFVWGGSVPTLTTGAFHVLEATYGASDELQSLWLTWEMNGASFPTPISGEIHIFAPDQPTPVEISLVESKWTGRENRVRWHTTGYGGEELAVERQVGDAPWEELAPAAPDGSGHVVVEDRVITRGARHGYRLIVVQDRRVLPSEAWVDVPEQVTLGIQRIGANPGPGPIQCEVAMSAPGSAALDLVDLAGRVIDHREWNELPEGRHVVRLDAAPSLAPGLYFARFRAMDRVLTRNIVVIR